jgi:hypothetical protein
MQTTLILTPKGIVEKEIIPKRMALKTNLPPSTSNSMSLNKKPDKVPLEEPNEKARQETIQETRQETKQEGQSPSSSQNKTINYSNQLRQPKRVGYSNLEVYTEIPVPLEYSSPKIITGGGRYGNNTTVIPAYPTKMQRVRVDQTTQISGFIDYGPTLRIPIREGNNGRTRYIQQKSPILVPIIDKISVSYD